MKTFLYKLYLRWRIQYLTRLEKDYNAGIRNAEYLAKETALERGVLEAKLERIEG